MIYPVIIFPQVAPPKSTIPTGGLLHRDISSFLNHTIRYTFVFSVIIFLYVYCCLRSDVDLDKVRGFEGEII